MLTLLFRIIILLGGNALGLWLAGKYIAGVMVPMPTTLAITPELTNLLIAAGVLTIINILIKPVLKLILSPVILLTLGLGIILVNAITIYILDYLMTSVTIAWPLPLLYATLLISAINFIIRKLK